MINRVPDEQTREALRKATAFAYGYCSVMAKIAESSYYASHTKGLIQDLLAFGCFKPDGFNLHYQYLASYHEGRTKAFKELEAKS